MTVLDIKALLRDPRIAGAGVLPIEAMDTAVENNPWHIHQTVWDHTVAVLAAASQIADGTWPVLPDRGTARAIQRHCSEAIETVSRGDILRLCALFHDVGKPATLVRDSDGSTSCPGHAAVGADALQVDRHKLPVSDSEFDLLRSLVVLHHRPDDFIDPVSGAVDGDALATFERKHEGAFCDLLLFYLADLDGCRLAEPLASRKATIVNAVTALVRKRLVR